jgi:hypothetical protein
MCIQKRITAQALPSDKHLKNKLEISCYIFHGAFSYHAVGTTLLSGAVTTVKLVVRLTSNTQCTVRLICGRMTKYTHYEFCNMLLNIASCNNPACSAAWENTLNCSSWRHPNANVFRRLKLYGHRPINMPKLQLWDERIGKAFAIFYANLGLLHTRALLSSSLPSDGSIPLLAEHGCI